MYGPSRRSKISLALAVGGFLSGSAQSWAQAPAADPCLSDRRCNDLTESAVSLSRAGQFAAALENYQTAYRLRPAPWLLINIGRVLQKMSRPREAIASYSQFLSSPAAQSDPELTTTARQYKRQAEQDLSKPAATTVVVMREERSPRPLWRLRLGSGLVASGVGLLGPGAYALGKTGYCTDDPVSPVMVCPQIYSGVAAGVPLVAIGAAGIVAGIITIALPGKVRMVSVPLPPAVPPAAKE